MTETMIPRRRTTSRRASAPVFGAAFAAALLTAPVSVPAANAPPPIKPNPVGMECRAAAAEFGAGNVWWGRFAGRRQPTGFLMFDTISVWRCFKTEKECRNWLYWKNTEYSQWMWESRCDKGYAGYDK